MNSGSDIFELYNGVFTISGKALFNSSNRAFRYGDGLFETFKVVDGEPLFFKDHLDRLSDGMKALHLSFNDEFGIFDLKKSISDLIQKNGHHSARVRFEVFRDGAGLYYPNTSDACWHMSSEELLPMPYFDSSNGLNVGIFNSDKKSTGVLSNLKTLNCLLYIMAAIHARKNDFDDVFIQNSRGDLIEAVSSNIFVLKDHVLTTPPLSDGCLNGVMRKNIILIARRQKISVNESSISQQMVLDADEILLTNVIKGVQWVKSFNGKNFTGDFAQKMISWVNESVSAGRKI